MNEKIATLSKKPTTTDVPPAFSRAFEDKPVPNSPSTTILFPKSGDVEQTNNVAHTIVRLEQQAGIRISLGAVSNATHTTGGAVIKSEKFLQLPDSLEGERVGIYTNERGTVAWQGNQRWIIPRDIQSPVNPITGEPLTPPSYANILANQSDVSPIPALPNPSQPIDYPTTPISPTAQAWSNSNYTHQQTLPSHLPGGNTVTNQDVNPETTSHISSGSSVQGSPVSYSSQTANPFIRPLSDMELKNAA